MKRGHDARRKSANSTRRRRAALLLLAVAGLLCGAVALAEAELSSSGNLFITFNGGISPTALPRDSRVPIAVWMSGKVRTLSGEKPPALRTVTLALNRNGTLDTKGLPTCHRRQLEAITSEEALAVCGDALVGTGRYRAKTTFPGQPPTPSVGKILAFNSKMHGKQAIMGQVYSDQARLQHQRDQLRDRASQGCLRHRPRRRGPGLAEPIQLPEEDQPQAVSHLHRPRPPPQLPLRPVRRPGGPQTCLLPLRPRFAVLRRRPYPGGDPDPHLQGEGLRRLASRPSRAAMPVAAIVAIASALAIAAPAAAAPTWLRPTGLTAEGDQAEAPRIALDAAGDATAVWLHFDGANYIVQSAARPAGGSWSAPVDLSAPGEDADAPQVAVDPGGDATAVWTRFNGAETGSNSIVQAASRAPGGSWSAPVDLSLVERNAEIPEVALDAAGDATAVWRRFDGANYIVQSAEPPRRRVLEWPRRTLPGRPQHGQPPT